jgi:hypothetical protein
MKCGSLQLPSKFRNRRSEKVFLNGKDVKFSFVNEKNMGGEVVK